MSKVTVVINKHGEASIVGVFTDQDQLKKLKDYVKDESEESYIRFYTIDLNHIDKHSLQTKEVSYD